MNSKNNSCKETFLFMNKYLTLIAVFLTVFLQGQKNTWVSQPYLIFGQLNLFIEFLSLGKFSAWFASWYSKQGWWCVNVCKLMCIINQIYRDGFCGFNMGFVVSTRVLWLLKTYCYFVSPCKSVWEEKEENWPTVPHLNIFNMK